jgi:HTH-type transcriptional regulator/antitoxin HigA
MTTNKQLYSDLAIPAGEFLAEVLETRQISQAELARRMGRPIPAINEIVKGEKTITPETALQLEQVLGVPAHIWTGLETQCQLVRAHAKEKEQLAQELPLLNQVPFNALANLGFVAKTRDAFDKVRELQRFFAVSALSNMPKVRAYAPAFRCSGKRNASPYALAAWLKCGDVRAQSCETRPYSKDAITTSLSDLRALTVKSPEEFEPVLRRKLADAGVALVMLPHLPKTYANGATFWLSPEKAVLMMSIRGGWADIFWFSLFHELAHILLHDKRMTFIEDGANNPGVKRQEDEANSFAANRLIPESDYEKLLKLQIIGPPTVRSFAQEIGVHPGIIVGRLQHDGKLPQGSPLNRMRTRFVWKEPVKA